MIILAIFLAATAATGMAQCAPTPEAITVLQQTNESPSPRGMILGFGSDWGAQFLVLKTTHRLAAFGVAAREGEETTTYITTWRELTCWKQLNAQTCPALNNYLRTLRGRSYDVMNNRNGLRERGADHPPFALLHAQDGDGNIVKIVSTSDDHPLMHDASQVFSALKPCTKDVDDLSGGL